MDIPCSLKPLLLISLMLLTACGGGGNSKSGTNTPTQTFSSTKLADSSKSEVIASSSEASLTSSTTSSFSSKSSLLTQTLTFQQVGPIELYVGDSWINFINSDGPGNLSYESSDTAIATVDGAGKINVLTSGKVTITANKKGNETYLPTQASYQIIAKPTGQAFEFTQKGTIAALAGDTLVNPAVGPGTGIITYSSSDPKIATVDNKGLVTIKTAGTAIIKAERAADAKYLGNTASYTLAAKLKTRKISFEQAGLLKLVWGETLKNKLTFEGVGKPTYTSSEPFMADVDENGLVTTKSSGSVTITAELAADPIYQFASQTYSIEIISDRFMLTSWMGPQDTQLTFSPALNGFEMTRYPSNSSCIYTDYHKCGNNLTDLLTGATFLDSTSSLNQKGHFTITYGLHKAVATLTPNQPFLGRYDHQLVSFQGKLWLVGGIEDETIKNDVWSSLDGTTWTEELDYAPFPAQQHQLVVFKNELWAFGSKAANRTNNEIWSSPDGINWTKRTSAPAYSPREDFQVLEFDGKLWLFGGTFLTDIWTSEDGINWVKSSLTMPVMDSKVITFNQKLWIIGGYKLSASDSVWSSDGASWQEHVVPEKFPSRFGHQILNMDNKLWMIGGSNSDSYVIWSSEDAIHWSFDYSARFLPRRFHQATIHKGNMWLIGGVDAQNKVVNDIWNSGTARWNRPTSKLPPLTGHQVIATNASLIIVGGQQPVNISSNASTFSLASKDGLSWTNEGTSMQSRWEQQVVFFKNSYLQIAGRYGSSFYRDISWSTDGRFWQSLVSSPGFSARAGHQVAVLNGKLWLVGGYDKSTVFSDVWSSSTGTSWTKETNVAPFGARSGHRVVNLNNKLFLIGGSDGTNTFNDIWSSSDGVNWIREVEHAPFSPRNNPAVTIHNNKIWLTGGQIQTFDNTGSTWSSSDGIHWTGEPSVKGMNQRSGSQLVSYKDALYLLGGLDLSPNSYNLPRNEIKNDIWRYTPETGWKLGQSGTYFLITPK